MPILRRRLPLFGDVLAPLRLGLTQGRRWVWVRPAALLRCYDGGGEGRHLARPYAGGVLVVGVPTQVVAHIVGGGRIDRPPDVGDAHAIGMGRCVVRAALPAGAHIHHAGRGPGGARHDLDAHLRGGVSAVEARLRDGGGCAACGYHGAAQRAGVGEAAVGEFHFGADVSPHIADYRVVFVGGRVVAVACAADYRPVASAVGGSFPDLRFQICLPAHCAAHAWSVH